MFAGGRRQATTPIKARKASIYEQWFEDWWLWELIAAVVSCLLAAALVILLEKYNGRPEPSFGTTFHSGITLGALISVLSSLCVATALVAIQESLSQLKWLWFAEKGRPLLDLETYDNASRGVIGSAKLLWKLRFTPLGSLGALLMIAQLIIAPLAQQSIRYVTVQVDVSNGLATLAVASQWQDEQESIQLPGAPDGYDVLGIGMKGATLNGLFTQANVTLNDTVPACGSGNCTFDNYQSLAVCASAADVTSSIKIDQTKSSEKWCLPGGLCISNAFTMMNVSSAAPIAQTDPLGGNLQSLNFTSIAFANHYSPIADVYILYANITGDRNGPCIMHDMAPKPFGAFAPPSRYRCDTFAHNI